MRLEEEDEQPARMARSDFETLFTAQMTGINRNNGRLRVSLSFAEKCQFRSKTPFSQPLRNAFRSCKINVTVLRSGTHVLITTKKCYFVDLIIMVLSTFE